jgi:hypothetical protein
MNSAYAIAEVAGTILVALGIVAAILRWFYKRGGTERAFKIALDRNTESTVQLTGAVDKVTDLLNGHSVQLATLDVRVTKLEAAPNVSVNVSPSAYRDAGSP